MILILTSAFIFSMSEYFSMSKIKNNSIHMYRNVFGGVWVMEIIEILFFLVFLVFLYRKLIIFPVFLQEIQTPGNVPL